MQQEKVTQEFSFCGFVPPVSNYFRMPNEWINICADINNLAELKIVQYVLRHTLGYQEYDGTPKKITVDEFMHGKKRKDGSRIDKGTGLSKPSVIQGLKYAIEHGYLTCDTDETDKARITKSYALKMMHPSSEVKDLYPTSRSKESLPQGSNIFTAEVKDLYIPEVKDLDSDQRKTREKQLKKNKIERKKEPTAKSTEGSFSHSSIPHSSFEKSSFSSETKAEEETVTLSPEEQQVYDLGSQTIFKVKPPKVTQTVKGHCAEIAKAGVTTLDKMESLVAFTKQEKHLIGKTLYLGNLVNALNGWLLSQQLSSKPSSSDKRPHIPYVIDHKRNEERKAALLAEFEALEAK